MTEAETSMIDTWVWWLASQLAGAVFVVLMLGVLILLAFGGLKLWDEWLDELHRVRERRERREKK